MKFNHLIQTFYINILIVITITLHIFSVLKKHLTKKKTSRMASFLFSLYSINQIQI